MRKDDQAGIIKKGPRSWVCQRSPLVVVQRATAASCGLTGLIGQFHSQIHSFPEIETLFVCLCGAARARYQPAYQAVEHYFRRSGHLSCMEQWLAILDALRLVIDCRSCTDLLVICVSHFYCRQGDDGFLDRGLFKPSSFLRRSTRLFLVSNDFRRVSP